MSPQPGASAGFAPLKAVRKSDEVYEQIHELVRSGHFPPGTRLPSERELTVQLQTSRQTIREALYRAEMVGLIEVRHGAGSFVRATPTATPGDARVLDLIVRQFDEVAGFLELRRLIECWCVEQAARKAQPADLEILVQKLAQMRVLELTDAEWHNNDVAFHMAIARATQNPTVVRLMEVLREGFVSMYRLKEVVPSSEEKHALWEHHWSIYEAIRRRTPEAARHAMLGHMDFVEEKLREALARIER